MIDPVIYTLQAELCNSMSHPTRIQILHILFDSPKNVGEIASITGLGQSTISRHLSILKRNNLVIAQRHGQEIIYRVANPKIIEVCILMRGVISEQATERSKMLEHSINEDWNKKK
ncbi:MAG: ArsR/SmtB family transcription factor [Anaerolineaceae bacterium]